MKLSKLYMIALLAGTLGVIGCSDDPPSEGNGGSGGTAGTGGAGPNLPPVADAGPNQGVEADNSGSEAVTLDGSGSADADGTIVSWSWSVNGAVIGTGETLTVSADVGTHTVDLTVTDDEGATDTDDVIITVTAPAGNLPPVADAGPNQSVLDADGNGSEQVFFDGSGSTDADGTIVRWTWSDIGTFDGPTGGGGTFDVGVHTVTLTVTDDEGATDTDDVTITVVEPAGNLPPVADAGPDQTVVDADNSGSAIVTLDGSGSVDLDGTIVSWAWSDIGAFGGPIGEAALDVGVHTVTLTVTDDEGATDTDEVTYTVRMPTITGVAIFDPTNWSGEGFLLRGDISDLGNLPGPCGIQNTWDDCISSILLSDGWSAVLFENDGFDGDSLVVETSNDDLGRPTSSTGGSTDWDNITSSIKIRAPN